MGLVGGFSWWVYWVWLVEWRVNAVDAVDEVGEVGAARTEGTALGGYMATQVHSAVGVRCSK